MMASRPACRSAAASLAWCSRPFLRLGAALGCGLMFGLAAVRGIEPSEPAPDREKTAIALEALSRLKGIDLQANPKIKAAVDRVLEQVRGRPEFVEIVRDFQLKDQDVGLLEVAARNPRDSSGVDAARLLLERQNLEVLRKGLEGSNAVSLEIGR